jgi:protein-histidine pros-kinase
MESALVQTESARKGEQEARKALESAIAQVRESERRFKGLAAATFEGVVVFRDGHVVDANARAEELFGISSPQLLGDPVLNLFDPSSMAELSFLIQDERGGSVELVGRRYDGSTFPTVVSVVEASHRGRPAQVMVLRDITDQKRVEEVLRRSLHEAEANSMARSSFLANMSHELRTPLNSVIGFANILRKKVGSELPPREADYLARIISNGEHLLALIEDILDLSKIDAERMDLLREPLQLEEIIDDVVRTLDIQARKRGIELVTEVPQSMRPLVADSRRLKQVLFNLVGNAVKFTLQGSVRVRVEAEEESGRPLRIDVIDTGIGIPSAKIEEIFAPFHQIDASSTRSFGGTGLGLTISRSLCDLMGFTISARSDEGKGSTFTIDLDPGSAPGRRDGSSPESAELLFAAEGTDQAERFR